VCGIAGVVDTAGHGRATLPLAAAMAARLTHRGPDDEGTWASPQADVCLGHTRLSILDLSAQGHQPMVSDGGRHVLVFNGEIYNHPDLRRKLGDERRFRGTSDTEVLLRALVEWGVERTLADVNGMFAFALWDVERRQLTLARDRLGEKPLYLARADGLLAFASDLAALHVVPGIDWSLDRNTVADFLKRGYVSGSQSIHAAVETLPPATIATFDVSAGRDVRRRYWVPEAGLVTLSSDAEERADAVEALLRDSIRLRSIADVPVGAFLSGGIDSSLVVALMQQECGGEVHTFSIGFDEVDMDEAPHARRIAEHLGTEHTEVYLSASDALDVVPKLPVIYTEPFADPSQIPTFLVCSVARSDVTVCLSGDGGDELFAGYDRYARTLELWRRFGMVPAGVRRVAAAGIRRVAPATWDRSLRRPYRIVRRRPAPADLGHKVRRLGDVLGRNGVGAIYDDLFSLWPDPQSLVRGARAPAEIGGEWNDEPPARWMTAVDLRAYLPDDILVKVDRASMAVSLEARVPMLDHRFVELALSLPDEDRLVDGVGKRMLRRVLARHVPAPLFERPKMGFGAPIDRWLRGPLRSWAEDLLDPERLAHDDLLDPVPIRARWHEHQNGERNWQYSLWAVLMLQQWRQHCGASSTRVAH
jgi:asparagine synthase (glutamine-hydrolysing)